MVNHVTEVKYLCLSGSPRRENSLIYGQKTNKNTLNFDATYALLDYLFLCGLRENLWNLHNCTPWARVCRYNNSENGAVDRPTLLPLICIQNKNVSVAWHVPGLHKYNAWVKILGREWLCLFLTTDFTNHTWMFYLVFPTEHVKRMRWRKKGKFVCMNIQFHVLYKLSVYGLCEWIIHPSMKVSRG